MLAGAGLTGALAFRAAAPDRGRCVGMFVATPGSGHVPRSIPADTTSLTVRGSIPCKDDVQAWVTQGEYRVFEDGTVEFLAVPFPPCKGGHYYVWIALPK